MAIKRWREFWRTPHESPHQVILDTIKGATVSLHGDFYGFTDDDIADIFIERHTAGLKVGIVADKTQSSGHKQRVLLQRLVDAGVEVVITTAPTGQINHSKHLLVDIILGPDANESYGIYGSLNLSGTGEAQENFVLLDNDPTICADLYAQYLEARAFGLKHPQWQLTPATATAPTPHPSGPSASPTATVTKESIP